ncbi:hypothetical protein V8E53_008662 [Lactarius tabidus]
MSEKTFVIMNKLAGLSWYLSDEKAVIGRYTDPTDREKWVVEYLDDRRAYIKSKEDNLFVGFDGVPGEGVKIVVGGRHIAKIWDVTPDHPPDYKIRLHGTNWVIAFDANYFVGIPATLQEENFPEKINQVWVLSPP